MGIFFASLGGLLLAIIPSVVGRIMVALSIGVVTYSGMSVTINWLKGQAITAAAGLPPDVIGMLSVLKVGSCISIIFSAILARMAINGIAGESFKKWVLK